MEPVQHKTDGRVIDIANQRPTVAVISHMAPPRQRLITHALAMGGGHLAQFVEIVEHPLAVIHRVG